MMADDKTPAKAPTPSPSNKTDDKAAADKAPEKEATGAALDVERMGPATGGVTEDMADELAALGVNPQLDNRTGRDRPTTAEAKAKPQQFPGPEVGHFAEHAEKYGPALAEAFGSAEGDPVGMHAGGPHGRGDRDGPSGADPEGNPDTRTNV